jgi:hypothetical protein
MREDAPCGDVLEGFPIYARLACRLCVWSLSTGGMWDDFMNSGYKDRFLLILCREVSLVLQ